MINKIRVIDNINISEENIEGFIELKKGEIYKADIVGDVLIRFLINDKFTKFYSFRLINNYFIEKI